MRRVLQLFAFAVLAAGARPDDRLSDRLPDGLLADALSSLARCRGSAAAVDRCLERDLARTVEDATRTGGGAAYRLNRYVTVELRPYRGRGDGAGDGLGARLVDLLDALRFRYDPWTTPGADDDVSSEGRKKYNKKYKKHKMGMMMAAASMGLTFFGGIAMKMMMGGVMTVAVKALLIAKVALLLAAIVTAKKLFNGGGGGGGGFGGGGGGGSYGGVQWNSGGGGTEPGGYHRSYHGQTDDAPGVPAANALAYRDQLVGSSYNSDAHYLQ